MFEEYIPFQFHILREFKQFELSNQIKQSFSDIINRVMKDDKKGLSEEQKERQREDVCQYVKNAYEKVSKQVIKEIRMQGNKKSTHCLQEVEFLYVCTYFLHKNYGISQEEAGKIFGLRKNEFAKLGIYPVRNCDAYHALCNKRMFPKNWNNEMGQEIAKLINQKILACYSCQGIYVVSNNADVFANLYHSCQQGWYSITFQPQGDLLHAVKDIGAFIFNSGNIIRDADGNRVGYGKIKEKILQVLDMQDKTMLDDFLSELLRMDNIELNEFVLDGEIASFQRMREQYQFSCETIQMGKEAIENDDYESIIFEDNFGAVEIAQGYQRWGERQDNTTRKTFESAKEIVDYHMKKAEKAINRLQPQLIENLDGQKLLEKKENIDIYRNWIRTIYQIESKDILFGRITEKMSTLAAWFYIITAFPLESIEKDVTQEKVQELRHFVESKQLAEYVNAIEREDKEDKKGVEKGDAITFIENKGEVLSVISELPIKRSKRKDNSYSLMVYIDIQDYDLQQSEVDEMLADDIALVVHGKKFDGVKLWDRRLELYTNVEGL